MAYAMSKSNSVPGASLNLQRVPWLKTFILFASILIASAATCFAQQKTPEQPFDDGLWHELGPRLAMRWSNNFIIYYDRTVIPRDYVLNVSNFLENAWDYYAAQGYIHPAYADKFRVSIEIKEKFPAYLSNALGFFVPRPPAARNPYMEIKNNLPHDVLRATCSHELFHFIQLAYDKDFKTGRWIKEATATWVEDEIPPAPSANEGYLFYQQSWYRLWSEGLSLNTDEPQHPQKRIMPYGSASFFKYLSEHHPKGKDLIRKFWENHNALQSGKDMMPAISFEVGGPEVFVEYFARFCTAAYLKEVPPYDFKRGALIREHIMPQEQLTRWHYSSFDGSTIIPAPFYPLQSLSARYYEFYNPGNLMQPSRFRLILKKSPDAVIMAKVIKVTANGFDVEDINFIGVEAEKVIENFSQAANGVHMITVVVCNPSLTPQRFEIAAAVGDPPYLKEIKVFRDNYKELIYHAKWEEAENQRAPKELKNGFDLKGEEKSIKNINVEALFSRNIEHATRIRLGEAANVNWLGEPQSERTVWRGDLDEFVIDEKSKGQGYIEIKLIAEAPDRVELDANPATIAYLDKKTLKWNNYESEDGRDTHMGGIDKIHKIKIKQEPEVIQKIPVVGKKFLVDSVFTKADADAILPDLQSFEISAEDKNGILLSVDGFGAGNQMVQFDLWWENNVDQVADVTIRLETNQGMTPVEVKENFLSFVRETSRKTTSDPRFNASYMWDAYGPTSEHVTFEGIVGTFWLTVHVKTGFQIVDHRAKAPIDASELSRKIVDKLRQNLDHIIFVED